MALTGNKPKTTIDDYMPVKEGIHFQLINNSAVGLPLPTVSHQVILTRIITILLNFLNSIDDKGLLIAGPVDVKFDDQNILHPDIFYIGENEKSMLLNESVKCVPDFIIEIISTESAYYDMRQKKDIYERHGVKEYIIIDTIGLKAELYNITDGAYILNQEVNETEKLNSTFFRKLSLDMSKIFTAV